MKIQRTRRKITVYSSGVLGLALFALPLTVQAATANTVISSVVSSTISLTTSGTVNLNALPSGAGVQTIASDTATVSTNDSAGYTLQLAENAASQNMVSGGNTITPDTGTQTTPAFETVGTWGYRVDSLGGFGAGPTSSASSAAISGSLKFAAVPITASPNTLVTTATTASSATTSIWYGIAVGTATPTGTYTNTVTYTATGN